MSNRRVVVTGLGCITPIGKNVEETWNGIENGVCGVDIMKLVNPETLKPRWMLKLRIIIHMIILT